MHLDLSFRRRRRSAYTLLEVLLAASIAVLLLSALYVAMRVQLRLAQDARHAVEQGTLIRSIVARIANDMSANLGALPAPSAASSSGGAGGSSGATPAPSSSSASGSTPSTGTPSASTPTSTGSAVVFNLGVQGDSTRVVLYATRAVRPPSSVETNLSTELALGTCDLRRITYWLVQGSGGALGLARQEVQQVTAENAMAIVPPEVPNEESFIIAPEVKNLAFKYFDGSEWKDEWDGSAAGVDGTSPTGPPLAISFEMSIAMPGTGQERLVRHVVAIQTANGLGQPTTDSSSSGTSGTGR